MSCVWERHPALSLLILVTNLKWSFFSSLIGLCETAYWSSQIKSLMGIGCCCFLFPALRDSWRTVLSVGSAWKHIQTHTHIHTPGYPQFWQDNNFPVNHVFTCTNTHLFCNTHTCRTAWTPTWPTCQRWHHTATKVRSASLSLYFLFPCLAAWICFCMSLKWRSFTHFSCANYTHIG